MSKIAGKLGVDKDDLFKLTWGVGYSFEANVRPIFASDREEAGVIFKASEMHFNMHTIVSMRESLKQSLRALEINPHGLPEAHVTVAYNYINLGMAAYSDRTAQRGNS